MGQGHGVGPVLTSKIVALTRILCNWLLWYRKVTSKLTRLFAYRLTARGFKRYLASEIYNFMLKYIILTIRLNQCKNYVYHVK